MPPKKSPKSKAGASPGKASKLKSLDQYLLAAWMMPGSVPPPRVALANEDNGKSSVDHFQRIHRLNWSTPSGEDYQLLDPSEMLIVISPKADQICRYLNPNPSHTFFSYDLIAAQGIDGGAASTAYFPFDEDMWLMFDWLEPTNETVYPLLAYDDHPLAQICHKKPGFYLDATLSTGTTIYVNAGAYANITADESDNGVVILWQWSDGKWIEYAATAANNFALATIFKPFGQVQFTVTGMPQLLLRLSPSEAGQ